MGDTSGLSRHRSTADSSAAVDAWMAGLQHPHRDAVELLRRIVKSADRAVCEGVKWNAPSFRIDEYFATLHLRSGVAVVLHRGARTRAPNVRPAIEDPAQLLRWRGPDRAIVEFADAADVDTKSTEFQSLLRRWIVQL